MRPRGVNVGAPLEGKGHPYDATVVRIDLREDGGCASRGVNVRVDPPPTAACRRLSRWTLATWVRRVHGAEVLDVEPGLHIQGACHLAAVGQPGARDRIRPVLSGAGREEPRDFVAIAGKPLCQAAFRGLLPMADRVIFSGARKPLANVPRDPIAPAGSSPFRGPEGGPVRCLCGHRVAGSLSRHRGTDE